MELLIMIDALKRSSAKSISAVIHTMVKYRQDKYPRVLISAKLVADLLEKTGINPL